MTTENFEHIARELRPRLQAIGRQFFADKTRADDVAQEVLMRLWLMRERIDLEQGVEPLAMRIAKNYCVNEWRREQRMQHSLRSQGAREPEIQDDALLAGGMAHVDDNLQDKRLDSSAPWFLGLLGNALAPYEQRLIRLRYEWDLPVHEIATIMGITPRSVSSILSTAKRKLQQQLKKGGQQL